MIQVRKISTGTKSNAGIWGKKDVRTLNRLLFLGALLCLATSASAQMNGWYVGAGGIESIFPKQTLKSSDIAGGKLKEANVLGPGLEGEVGFAFSRGGRIEEQLSWKQNGVLSFSGLAPSQTTGRGNINQISGMTNVLYDIPTGWVYLPAVTLGAGIGALNIQASRVRTASGTDITSDNNWAFAGQLIAGELIPLSDTWSLKVDFNYLLASSVNLLENPAIAGGATTHNFSLASHSYGVTMGFTYQFGKVLYGGM